MMIVGAVCASAAAAPPVSGLLGILPGAAAALRLAFGFGVLTLTLAANQVATGLALTICGLGLSSLRGAGFVGIPVAPLPKLDLPGISDLPLFGPLLFGHDALVYLSLAAVVAVAWFLKESRPGMILRAVGESDISAHSIGYDVIAVRYRAVLFGGAMAGQIGRAHV